MSREREQAMAEAVQREIAALGPPPPSGAGHAATLDYIRRVYEGSNRILKTPLPPEPWWKRLSRWLVR